jgi:hypothetical protein
MPDETQDPPAERDMLAEALAKGPLPGVPTPEQDAEQAAEEATAKERDELSVADESELLRGFNVRMD